MREIKFRGYDAESKVWRYGNYMHIEDITLCVIYDSKEEWEKDYEKNNHHWIVWNGSSDWNMSKPHYKSEVDKDSVGQYTGLKDRNGKEIYEGDIVHVIYNDNGNHKADVVEVTYDKDGYSPMNWEYECDECECSTEITSLEVIGNIYENPELESEVEK